MAGLRREQPGAAWIAERCDDQGGAVATPLGLVPAADAIDVSGLDLPEGAMEKVMDVDTSEWREQLPQISDHFATFGHKLPPELAEQLRSLEERLSS